MTSVYSVDTSSIIRLHRELPRDVFPTVWEHPDWVQERQNAGDLWVVANAVVHSRIVLTEEAMKGPGTTDKNLKIPNVAHEHDVSCVNFNQLARTEGWSF